MAVRREYTSKVLYKGGSRSKCRGQGEDTGTVEYLKSKAFKKKKVKKVSKRGMSTELNNRVVV